MAGKFELYQDKAGEYRWRFRHQNGNNIADSYEGYKTKANAINGIESVKKNVALANIKDLDAPQPVAAPEVKPEVKEEVKPEVKAPPVEPGPVFISETPKATASAPAKEKKKDRGHVILVASILAAAWFIISAGIFIEILDLY